MEITNLTKNIGEIIAKIKNNNKLVEELNKSFNPTFVEIIESLQKTDPTLAKMLMVWYMETYSIDDKRLNDIVNKYQVKKKVKPVYVAESGCGNTSGWLYGGGCGSSSVSRSYSGGCGSSSRSGGC